MHSHSHCQRLDQLLLLSIDAWTYGCSVGTCIFRRLGYYVAPHFAPGRRGNKKPCTINMIEYWLHSASRNRPPPLRKPVLSFFLFPRPDIARLLRRWLNLLGLTLHLLPNRFLRQVVPTSPLVTPALCSATLGSVFSVNPSHLLIKEKKKGMDCRPAVAVVKRGTP